jgi:TetR/AcrR family transcriptional regulator, regulator of autoinduction and epiphytic fitness
MSALVDPSSQIDGRELRSIRTRAAIVDAWLELMSEGDLAPTAKDVADRARIGLRTVFQHFSDMNALQRAACEQQINRVLDTTERVSPDLPLAERIDAVARTRARIWEDVTMLRRACERQEWLSADIQGFLTRWERATEELTRRVFATEFAQLSGKQCIIQSVDALLSWSTWNQLRHRRSLPVEEAISVLVGSVSTLLDLHRTSIVND